MNVVEAREVSVRYGGVPVLDAVDLTIEAGEFLAILGPNGSGKTTLLRTFTGLLEPDQGTVTVFGRPALALGDQRRRLGYLPQAGSINFGFPVTALQVVMMGLYAGLGAGRYPRRAERRLAQAAMERMDVLDAARYPLAELSGGQRQRVLLARTLVHRPDLLLLDEPTAAMDTASVEAFYALMHELRAGGATIVLISHDLGVIASQVSRVACLNRRLVAHGRPDAVLGEEVLREMYGCDTLFFHHGHSPHMVVRSHGDG